MNKWHVALLEPMHEAGIKALRARPDIELTILPPGAGPEAVAAIVPKVHAVGMRIAKLPASLLAQAKDMRVVAKHGVGVDNVDIAHCTSRGIPVMVTSLANAQSVAEHAMMMMLALAKRTLFFDKLIRDQRFAERTTLGAGIDLSGRTLLIIGFGRIGSRVAPLARAFGMTVRGYDPYIDQTVMRDAGVELVEDYRKALATADVVTLHVPLNDGTRHMLGPAEIAVMPRHALVINCARGGILDEPALAAALVEGRIRAAGIDVFEDEPPPGDHPFFSAPNLLLTPHSAAMTEEAQVRMSEGVAENILGVLDGHPPLANVFNRKELGW